MTPFDQLPAEGLAFSYEDDEPTEDEIYWADRRGSELITALDDKEHAFFDALDRGTFLSMWKTQYAQYYGRDLGGKGGAMGSHSIQSSGEDGEQLIFRLNESRSIITQQIQITTGERASFQCLAANDDYESVAQVEPCDGLVEYTYRTAHAEQKEREIFESDSNFGSGFGVVRWDYEGGDDVQVEEETPVNPDDPSMGATIETVTARSGAPMVTVGYPWELVGEPHAKDHLWRIFRERRSKYQLAAKWPEYAEKIRAMQGLDEWTTERLFGLAYDDQDTDDVIVKHFYHASSTALPGGRHVSYVGDITLEDEACPVKKGLPIVEMCSEKYIGHSFGYAAAWMLNAPNQMIDQLLSDTGTNLAAFGRQVIAIPEGTDFDLNALANGTRALIIPMGSEKPEAMLFAGMPEHVKWVLEFLLRRMEALSGVNGVTRGDPQVNISSGAMAALFHEIAVEYMGARQVARDFYREGMANLFLDMMRANGRSEFVAQIVGDSDRPYMKSFALEQVAGVKKVIVKTKNPILSTTRGRMELMGAVAGIENPKDRRAAVELILNGNTDLFTDHDSTETLAIKWENKMLSQGIAVPVMINDNHETHYLDHKASFNKQREQFITSEERKAARQAHLAHMDAHKAAYYMMDPVYAEWNGMQVPPQFRGLPGPAPVPKNMAPEGSMGASGGSGATSISGGGASAPVQAAGVDMPEPADPAQSPSGPAQDQGEAA